MKESGYGLGGENDRMTVYDDYIKNAGLEYVPLAFLVFAAACVNRCGDLSRLE